MKRPLISSPPLEPSLSILLPIQNAERSLRGDAIRLLDVASELAREFDLLIWDNGSADDSFGAARDLRAQFPQVRIHRSPQRASLADIVRRGLELTSGDIVFLHEGEGEIDTADLAQLWRLRHDDDLIVARESRAASRDMRHWAERLLAGSGNLPGRKSGFHMLRRDRLDELEGESVVLTAGQQVRLRRDEPNADDRFAAGRPSFLGKLRQLAWGE